MNGANHWLAPSSTLSSKLAPRCHTRVPFESLLAFFKYFYIIKIFSLENELRSLTRYGLITFRFSVLKMISSEQGLAFLAFDYCARTHRHRHRQRHRSQGRRRIFTTSPFLKQRGRALGQDGRGCFDDPFRIIDTVLGAWMVLGENTESLLRGFARCVSRPGA